MVSRHATLLEDATRQVQIADHLLTMTYPLVKDPKLLMSIIEHIRRAIIDASEAVLEFHISRQEYEFPKSAHSVDGKENTLVAFADLLKVRNPHIPSANEAIQVCNELVATLLQYKESPVTFPRQEKLVIADSEFALKEVTAVALKPILHTSKQFVAGVTKHIMLSGEAVKRNEEK